MNTRNTLLVLLALTATACSGGESGGTHAALSAGKSLPVLEMRWPDRSAADIDARFHALAEVLVQEELPSRSLDELRAAPAERGVRPFASHPSVELAYSRNVDEYQAFNNDLYGEISGDDIGEESARSVMKDTLADLERAGLVNRTWFDTSKAQVGYHKIAWGTRDSGVPDEEHVSAYHFTLMRRVQGIPVINAGIEIAIHRTGALSAIRLGGVEIETSGRGAAEEPAGLGYMRGREVSTAEIEERFNEGIPAGKSAKVNDEAPLAYVLPKDGPRSAVVEPQHVYCYSLRGASGAVSRERCKAYSVFDRAAAPEKLFNTL